MTREAFRTRAGARWPSGADDVILLYLELARLCPEFPVDLRQETRMPIAHSRSGRRRGIFTWAARCFSRS
jgi:hypothetical protein